MTARTFQPRLSSWWLALLLVPVAVGGAADDLSDLKPGTKVIVDIGGEAVGEVVEKVAAGVYRIRVKIHTGDVIEPALPTQNLRLAPAGAETSVAAPPSGSKPASAAAGTSITATGGSVTVSSGTATPGKVTAGTVTPGKVTPGTVTPGTVTSGTVGTADVQGKVTVTPGTVTPGRVTPGTVTPGTVTQGTTPPVTITQGTATPGNVTPGTVTPGTVTPGTVTPGKVTPGVVIPGTATAGTATAGAATSGAATSGTTTTSGTASAGVPEEQFLSETPAGKAEIQSLVGAWKIVAVHRNGRPDPRPSGTITIQPAFIKIEQAVFDQVRIDPSSNPRRIDLVKAGSAGILRGVYERRGDRLRICLAEGDDAGRPIDFATNENDGRILYECELGR